MAIYKITTNAEIKEVVDKKHISKYDGTMRQVVARYYISNAVHLVWELISSCFAFAWFNDRSWSNDTAWNN